MSEAPVSALHRVIAPRSVVIVGASPRSGSVGQTTLANMLQFDGRLHLVNARYASVDGHPCLPSVKDLPEVPDCAIVTVGQEAVEGVLTQCVEAGIGGAIVYASGYAELGTREAIDAQQRLADIAHSGGMRLVGPNCAGLVNFKLRMGATFATGTELPLPGDVAVAVVSQSGALGLGLGQAVGNGVSLSHLLTAGNSCDVDVCDYITYLAGDSSCRAISCVFEGLREPMRLVAAAEAAAASGKPLVIFKLAVSERGAQAALSHSGSLAGAQATYQAALRGTGAVLVDHWEQLLETSTFFAKATRRSSTGCAIVATSGGAAVMGADCADRHGVELPAPSAGVLAVLRENLPPFATPGNPCDVTAQVQSQRSGLMACSEALLSGKEYGALVVAQTRVNVASAARITEFETLAATAGKPLCLVWLSGWTDGAPGLQALERSAHVALFRSMDRCFAAIAAWNRWHDLQEARTGHLAAPGGKVVPEPSLPPGAVARVTQRIRAAAHDNITEREAKDILSTYGIPVVRDTLTAQVEDAVAAAREMGYPIVLKVESPDIPHKTEAGVVALGVSGDNALREAYARLLRRAALLSPAPRIAGVLVQPMVASGVEVMVGSRNDPQFGPLVIVGLGGVMVELMKDVQIALAPVDPNQAMEMLKRLRGAPLLTGFRGSAAVDMEQLALVVCRLSQFAHDQAGLLQEFDVNPLICTPSGVTAVDALLVRRPLNKSEITQPAAEMA
ncbi:MAG: acetate--CoA ligase family protein [Burkholderiaceae bacterium]|nr:acetate--CoA ligase family protein [Burkholderiaceae bacterium]MDO9088518.1 acetate--CoA ligase family protein [Burkholderiaceae bacterium]MDP1968712.1 acetate--CoA ligase family protein [Burkholderiaceae bacterium]